LEILKDFGFSREEDEEVARELDASLGGTRASDEELLSLFEGDEVTVAGNGPNLSREIDGAPGVLLTADEATTVAMARGRIPAAVVTDLDGTVADQVKANDAGAIVLVHGHGDNGPAVRKWAPPSGPLPCGRSRSGWGPHGRRRPGSRRCSAARIGGRPDPRKRTSSRARRPRRASISSPSPSVRS